MLRHPSVRIGALSHDGRLLLFDDEEYRIQVWDVTTGRRIRTLVGHSGPIGTGVFSPDGRRIVTASSDRTVRVRDVGSGELLRTFSGEKKLLEAVAFSPDSRFCLTDDSECARLWDVESGTTLRTFEGRATSVACVCFSTDSRWAIWGSGDRTVQLWELEWDYEFPKQADDDDGARPFFDAFLARHTPEPQGLLRRKRPPVWSDQEFDQLIVELGHRGYGWLRPEGVRKKLDALARDRR